MTRSAPPDSRSEDPPAGGSGASAGRPAGVRRLFLDLTPLRLDGQYRLLLGSHLLSVTGNQITRLALPFQVYVLTGSPLAIAGVMGAQLIPILVLSLLAGSVADAFDRRRVLITTQVGLAVTNVGFVALSLQEDPPVWLFFVLAACTGSFLAVDWPARLAAVPRLVPSERLPAAIALSQLSQNSSQIIGPAIGGLILAWQGPTGAYVADLVAFSVSIWGLVLLRPIPPMHQVMAPGLTAIREGLSFVRTRRAILGVFAIDLNAMIFGRPIGLFPVLALDVFHVGAAGVGLLTAAPAAGAFVGAVFSGWISGIRGSGRAVVLSVIAWGSMVTLFGFASFSFALALLLLAVSGAADVLSTMLRWTIIQVETPDQLRGRVTSINNMIVTSGPRLGDIRAATVASLVGSQVAVVSGGIMCVAGALVMARAFPELMSHRFKLRSESSS